MIKIVIADDHALIREGLKTIIGKSDKYEIVGEAADGKACINLLKLTPVDILLLDIDMPEKNGVEVGKWIKSMQLDIKIVYITSHADFFSFYQAWKLNPTGFLFKENALEDMLSCLQHINNGKKYYSSQTKEYIDQNEEKIKQYEAIFDKIQLLSVREQQILLYIAESKTTREIADILFNSYKTIENHRYNISKKLEITGSNNLMRFGIQYYDLIKSLVNSNINKL